MKGLLKFIWVLIQIVFIVGLPFFILIRSSVWLYTSKELTTWLAFGAAAGMTCILLLIYLITIFTFLFGAKHISSNSLKVKAFLVILMLGAYSFFTMANLNIKNAKSDEVRKEFRSLHPILRLGIGSMMVLDRSAIVTDFSRTPLDYDAMGLKRLKNSLHYKQKDGYVHALDLRTNGRSGFRNWVVKQYFELMGYQTLRHTGTADHLHVSLPPHDKPNVK